MSRYYLVVALPLVLVTACNKDKELAAKTSKETSKTENVKYANPPAVGEAKLKVGDPVEVCWRYAPKGKRFAKNDAPFQCPESVRAVKTPWKGTEGGVHGKLLTDALRKSVPTIDPSKAWLRSVEPKKDPREPCSTSSLDDKTNSFHNSSVGVDASEKFRIYIDVEGP